MDPSRFKALLALTRTAALRGGRVNEWSNSFDLGYRPYCDDPVSIGGQVTRRDLETLQFARETRRAFEVSGLAPCRKCKKCLQYKQMFWRERALREIELAPRTWFITLTFSPGHLLTVHAGKYREKGAVEKRLEKSAYRHVQRYLKRLRKRESFRYLAIFERGEKTGRPHFHMLLHEKVHNRPVVKRKIERTWSSPIVHARLVPPDLSVETIDGRETKNVASYVTKYCTKDATTRFRSSTNYGGAFISK